MARRVEKKARTNKAQALSAVPPASNPGSENKGGGFPFAVLLIVVILGVLYGPSLFKGVFQGSREGSASPSKPSGKFFLLKKTLQFSGEDTLGKPFFANDVAVISGHEFAVTDNLGGQVLVFDFKGKLVRKWGKNGNGPKDFQEPSGIVTDGKGKLFVLDTMNNAIKTFDTQGKLLGVKELKDYGIFPTPRRLGWGGNCLLVANANDARLNRLSLNKWELLGSWGEKGAGSGGLWGVSKAISDGKGSFYMGDMNAKDSCVRIYDATGNVKQLIKTGTKADTLGLDPKGRLFVGAWGDYSKVFDSAGSLIGFLGDEAQPGDPLNQVTGIDFTTNGTVVISGGSTVSIYQEIEDKPKS